MIARPVYAVLVTIALLSSSAGSQQPVPEECVKDTIYVAPMSGGLDQFIVQRLLRASEVHVVFDAEQANFIMIGASESRITTRSNQTGWWNISEQNEGEVMVLSARTRKPVWSTNKGSNAYEVFFGAGVSKAKIADRIVKQLRKDLRKAWTKHGDEVRQKCAALGIDIGPVPK